MLDAMPSAAGAVGLCRVFVRVECHAHGPVSDCMQFDLQSGIVVRRNGHVQRCCTPEWQSCSAADVRLEHHRGFCVDRSVQHPLRDAVRKQRRSSRVPHCDVARDLLSCHVVRERNRNAKAYAHGAARDGLLHCVECRTGWFARRCFLQ